MSRALCGPLLFVVVAGSSGCEIWDALFLVNAENAELEMTPSSGEPSSHRFLDDDLSSLLCDAPVVETVAIHFSANDASGAGLNVGVNGEFAAARDGSVIDLDSDAGLDIVGLSAFHADADGNIAEYRFAPRGKVKVAQFAADDAARAAILKVELDDVVVTDIEGRTLQIKGFLRATLGELPDDEP